MHVGIQDFEDDLKSNMVVRLRKQLKALEFVINAVFDPMITTNLEIPFIYRSELLFGASGLSSHMKKNEKIVDLIKKLKQKFNIAHLALWLQNKIYICTSGWNSLHDADK
jgi:hypothetical protein